MLFGAAPFNLPNTVFLPLIMMYPTLAIVLISYHKINILIRGARTQQANLKKKIKNRKIFVILCYLKIEKMWLETTCHDKKLLRGRGVPENYYLAIFGRRIFFHYCIVICNHLKSPWVWDRDSRNSFFSPSY